MLAFRRHATAVPYAVVLALLLAPGSVAAQRKATPELDALLTAAKADPLEASLRADASGAWHDVLARASAEMLAGRPAADVAAEIEKLRRQTARDLSALARTPPDRPEQDGGAPRASPRDATRGRGPSAAAEPSRHGGGTSEPRTTTVFAEEESLIRSPKGGLLINVRMEMTTIHEGRRVGVRIESRETTEMNPSLRSDTPSAEKYIVESGTSYPATGERKVDQAGTRRLRPTSEFRMTMVSVREAKVDRCPNAAGQSHGGTSISTQVRATSAASGTGVPVALESNARGASVVHVDDAAKVAGFDVDFESDYRLEALGSGTDLRARTTTGWWIRGGGVSRTDARAVTFEGHGSDESGEAAVEAVYSSQLAAFAVLLFAAFNAEDWWRKPGNCYELVAASGAAPKEIEPGERRQVVIGARHKEEAAAPEVPVSGKASYGTLTPQAPVRTPKAGFTYAHPPRKGAGTSLTFSSVSRRGIAPELTISLDAKKEIATVAFRLAYVGYKFVESTEEDCTGMRPGGRETLTAELRRVSSDPSGAVYEGAGRLSADIDACGLTPNRADPGMAQNPGTAPGDFQGENFLGCKVTTVVPEHPVRVRVQVDMEDARRPNYVEVEWEPTGGPVHVQVRSGCEPPYHAGYVRQMTEAYRSGSSRQITDYDLLPRLAPGGRLREGTFRSEEDEGLTITVGDEIEIPSLVDDEVEIPSLVEE